MPRRPRVFLEGGIYHVYNRFARGADIFQEPGEVDSFLDLVREIKVRDDLTVFAWSVMSNHYHLALRSGPIPLSRSIGSIQARFGQSYNMRRNSSGPRWQSRFKAKLVMKSELLHHLVAYIHLNPVAAELVKDPAEHPYSGHRELIEETDQPLIDVDAVLDWFGDTPAAARWSYVRTLRATIDAKWCGEMPGRLPWWERETDRPLEPEKPPAWTDELGRSTGLERRFMEPQEFFAESCTLLGIEPVEIAGPARGREITRHRYLLMTLGVERWGQRPKRIGELMGRRGDVASRWVRQGSALRHSDDEFRRSYDELDRGLAEPSRANSSA